MVKPSVFLAAPVPLDQVKPLDWKLCCLCQKLGGALSCPAKNPIVARRHLGYSSLANTLEQLKSSEYRLDSGFMVEVLDEGTGIEATLITREAKWHKACALKFTPSKSADIVGAFKNDSSGEKKSDLGSLEEPTKRSTRSTVSFVNLKEEICFLCKGPGSKKNPLRHCATTGIYERLKQCVSAIDDSELKALLTEGDLVAQEGKYHLLCLARLYNKRERQSSSSSQDQERIMCEGMAFADLLIFIQTKLNESPGMAFKMGDLFHMYHSRLSQLLGLKKEELSQEHRTRFREKILAHFPSLRADKCKKEYVLLHEDSNLLSVLHREDQDEDALAFHFFAKKLRKTVMSASKMSFDGSFKKGCEEECIPAPLLAVVNTILYGTPVHTGCRATKPALTICQLLLLNYHEKAPTGDVVRNKREREPPLPLYLGLSCYGKTRDKGRIDEMHKMGICVSSNRVMEVTSQLCRMVVNRSKEKNVVCPSVLRHGIFTVGALDNIDLRTSSNTAVGDYHGVGASLFQLVSNENQGSAQVYETTYQDAESKGNRSVPQLPDSYTSIPDVILREKQPTPVGCTSEIGARMMVTDFSETFWKKESSWLSHINECMNDDSRGGTLLNMSWAGFHSSKVENYRPPAVNALLPLFNEKSSNPAMIKHGMDLVRKLTTHLNGDQVPVLCGDQPVFTLMKTIQWNWPDEYGEERFVAMLGPLHIEQVLLRVLGQYAEGSGWTTVIANSGVTTSGSAEAIAKVTHIVRARIMHQQTAAVLYSLLNDAYETAEQEGEVSIEQWIREKAKTCPTFKYWLIFLNLEVLLLSFVKSVRMGNFDLYVDTLRNIQPWLLLFDHSNYARWLPIHLQDMVELSEKSPAVWAEFKAGKFVVNKSGKPFSALGIDHAHEQNNASVKGKGGAVGLTQDPSALTRWMVGGPEVSRLIEEFEEQEEGDITLVHHEKNPSFQKKFVQNCAAIKESFLQFKNPFETESDELLAIDTNRVAAQDGIDTLNSLLKTGTALSKSFIEERLVEKSKSLYDSLSKTQTRIFTAPTKQSSRNSEISKLKADVSLFSRMFIVSTVRELDLKEFFRHENQLCPPSLSSNGELKEGNKAHLVQILEKVGTKPEFSQCDGIVFDGASVIHLLKPSTKVKSLKEYCDSQLVPYIMKQVQISKAKRVDIAWDLYPPNRIQKARDGCSAGIRQVDLPEKGILPKNWERYLKNTSNKTELFKFIAERFISSVKGLHAVSNVDKLFQSNRGSNESSLHGSDCSSSEEADGRVFLHVKDMAEHGAESVLICCSDTDILVLAISFFHTLFKIGLRELWVLFGAGANRRYIPAHTIAMQLGCDRAEALRGFHAFTGADKCSYFSSRGKKSAWTTWGQNSDFTKAFKQLGQPLKLNKDGHLDPSLLNSLEAFTAKLYGSDEQCVDDARRVLFCTSGRPITMIPPTQAALVQHTKRACYQAGHIWGQALKLRPKLPPVEDWGWCWTEGRWKPLWTTRESIWAACRDLDRCGCGSACDTQRCLCRRLGLPCTPACKKCKGACSNTRTFVPTMQPIQEESEECFVD